MGYNQPPPPNREPHPLSPQGRVKVKSDAEEAVEHCTDALVREWAAKYLELERYLQIVEVRLDESRRARLGRY